MKTFLNFLASFTLVLSAVCLIRAVNSLQECYLYYMLYCLGLTIVIVAITERRYPTVFED